MKKILSTVAAAALIATSSFALDTSKLYGGAGLGLESGPSGVDSGIALILDAGLPVMEAGQAGPGTVAVEGEFTYSLSPMSYGSVDVTGMTLGAYGAYIMDINQQLFVKPRVGLVYRSLSFDGYSAADSSEVGLAFGVQGGFKLNEKMDIIVGYNMLDGGDWTQLSAGIQMKF